MSDFLASPGLSVGMEMEFQIVDADTLNLADGVIPLLEQFEGTPNVKSEFIQNTIEVASDPCPDVASLEANMHGFIGPLVQRASALGLRLCGAGTHPFSRRLALITPLPRYEAMEKSYGLISHSQITFATHVHVGVASGDQAARLMTELKPYLPLLIALSANSPYWRGHETGFAAYRHRILASSRSYGLPPDFSDWASFEAFLAAAINAKMFESIHDIHWDIRPRPHLGTVEVRIMDAQATVTEAVRLAAFVRSLVAYLNAARDNDNHCKPLIPLPWWSQKDNCFGASRDGMDAQLISTAGGDLAPMGSTLTNLAAMLLDFADAREQSALRQIPGLVAQPPYDAQRRACKRYGLEALTERLSDALSEDLERFVR